MLVDVKAAVLVPDEWHFKREAHPNTFAYFASREDIDRDGEFLLGLTVNVMPRVEGRDAPAYAKDFISRYSKGGKLLESWDASMGPFVGSGCRVQIDQSIMHTLMIANPKTNTLYLFIFEAPVAEWQEAWERYGETLIRFMLLDDEV
jgi:hypothetical protein